MDRNPIVRKCLAVGIILLFVGTGIIPSTAQNREKQDDISDTPYNISEGDYQEQYPIMFSYDMTELAITPILPLAMIIKNIGNATAFNVSWSITVTGRFIFIGRSSSGVLLGPLESGQEITVGRQNQLLMGLGSIEITHSAWADNAPMVSASLTAKLILFFLII